MSKSAAIIIATTGKSVVKKAIESSLNQTHKNKKVYLVVDGDIFLESTKKIGRAHV